MAMRPASRGGAGTSSRPPPRPGVGVQNVYEDFKPTSEWRQDEESDILLLFLSGFMKQHLKVSTEGRNIVRVRGERLVTGNKWSRFQEDYQVPERCNIRAIRARFEGGILTIILPWKEDAAAKATLPIEVPPKATSSMDKNTEKKQQISPPKAPIEPGSKKSADEIPPQVPNPPSRPHKGADEIQPKKLAPPSVSSDKGSKDDEKRLSQPQTQKGHQDEQRNRARSPAVIKPTTTSMTISSDDGEKKEMISPETKAKPMKPDYIDNLRGVSDDKRITEKSKEPLTTLAENLTRKMNGEKEKQSQTAVASSSSKDDGLGNYEKAVKSLAELSEERQLLVNIGVAVLVIVALGAYIASRIGTEEA